MNHRLRFAVTTALLVHCSVAVFAAEPPDGNPRTVYFTVGDAQDLLEFAPLDSRNTIATAFETLKTQWAVERIWWRGGQDEIWGEQFVIRPENRHFAKVWDWWRDMQYRKVGTNRIAVDEAHKRGMKISLTYGLFDSGSQADAGYSGFPYAVEDKLRVEHPEWRPVNRWGTWQHGGPIEFAYPEAREAMATYLAKAVIDGGYDEISFLTYAENFSQRYEDEFGYAEPIVEEYRQKFGVDIRKDDFNRDEWRKIRGEHVTEFLRLLKQKLAPHGKEIAVCVHGRNFDRAMLWLIDGGVCTAGNFSWSIDDWLKGDVVDEITLFYGNDNATVQTMLDRADAVKSSVRISAYRSRGQLPGKTPRVMFLGREIESGYMAEAWIDYPDEQLSPEPLSSLGSDDMYARRRVLTLALKGKLSPTPAQWSHALGDEDIYVRRSALRAIARHRPDGVIFAVRERLNDPEITGRCLAALALAELGDVDSLPAILAQAAEPDSTYLFQYRAVPDALKKFIADETQAKIAKSLLVQQLTDEREHAREIALYDFTIIGAPATPEVEQRLTEIVLHDTSEYARELGLVNLRSSFGATATVTKIMRQVMQSDASHAVQVRAATAFAFMHSRLPVDAPERTAALQEAIDYFKQYGDGCERTDRDWGWRLLGNTLLEFGPAGDAALRVVMAETQDRQASDRAWKILYLKQGDRFFPITPEEDAAAHEQHPWLR